MNIFSTASIVCLSAGVALSSATQLRIPGAPYGVGEFLLVSGSLGLILSLLTGARLERSRLLLAFGGFWLIALATLTAGALSISPDTVLNDFQQTAFLHDARAFVFVAVVLFALLAPAGTESRIRQVAVLMLAFSILPLSALWLIARHATTIGPLNLWYGPRFLGWTQNPNQLALVVITTPFIAFYLCTRARRLTSRLLLAGAGLAAIVLGVASQSDALTLSWVVGGLTLMLVLWGKLAVRGRRAGIAGALAYAVAPASLLLVCLWAGPTIERRVVRSFEKTADEGHQGSTRVELWKRGFRSFLSAPVFGLGPGPHAGDERVRGEEAHNTMIDWAASTGIVGLSAYLALLAWVGIVTWRSGNELLISGFIALLCFSSFHYVLRHPIYWQQLLAIAAFALPPAPVAVSSRAALPTRRPRFTASASGARSPAG